MKTKKKTRQTARKVAKKAKKKKKVDDSKPLFTNSTGVCQVVLPTSRLSL